MNKNKDEEQQQVFTQSTNFNSSKQIQQCSNSTQFGTNPLVTKCPFCLQKIQSQIISKPEFASILLAFLLFSLIPNFFTLIIVVFLLQFTATKKHRCPLCEMQLGTDGKFLGFFTDQIYSFSIAGTGLILTKKIIASALIILLTLGIIFVRIEFFQRQIEWIDLSWEDLRMKCPQDVLNTKCISELQQKTVRDWHGFVMKIEDNRQSLKRYYMHAVTMYIKMEPSEHEQRLPDIMISADSRTVYQFNQMFDQLKHGDQIIFNATFKSMKQGKGVKSGRHFHLESFNRTTRNNPNVVVYVNEAQVQWFNQHVLKHSSTELRRQVASVADKQNLKQLNKPEPSKTSLINSDTQNKQYQKQ